MYFSEFFIFGFCYWVSMYNVCQPRFETNGVLADVGTCLGGVVAEAVVGEPRLCVEVRPLIQEGHQPHFVLLYAHTPMISSSRFQMRLPSSSYASTGVPRSSEMMEYRLSPTIFAEGICPPPTILFFIFERCKKKIVQHPTYDLFP